MAKGSFLQYIDNSSDLSDCEDHEGYILAAIRTGALHPHHLELLYDRLLSIRAPGSKPQNADIHHHGGDVFPAGGYHNQFRKKSAQAGSDEADELLKALQSYISVPRNSLHFIAIFQAQLRALLKEGYQWSTKLEEISNLKP